MCGPLPENRHEPQAAALGGHRRHPACQCAAGLRGGGAGGPGNRRQPHTSIDRHAVRRAGQPGRHRLYALLRHQLHLHRPCCGPRLSCRLFNIGGEGQATLGGLGAGLAALALDHGVSPLLAIPLSIVAAAGFGALWAAIPAWLQAWRGSHIVITTIMFNFLAASLMVYLMVNVLIAPGSMSPESVDLHPRSCR